MKAEKVNEWKEIEQARTLPATIQAKTFSIVDHESRVQATNLLTTVKQEIKTITAQAGLIIDPINTALKRARSERDRILKPWEDAESYLKQIIREDVAEQERQKKIEQQKIQEALEKEYQKAQDKLTSDNPAVVEKAKEKLEQKAETILEKYKTTDPVYDLPLKKVWKYRVVDFAKVPDEFKEISPGAIRSAMSKRDADNRPEAIPGIEFYQDTAL